METEGTENPIPRGDEYSFRRWLHSGRLSKTIRGKVGCGNVRSGPKRKPFIRGPTRDSRLRRRARNVTSYATWTYSEGINQMLCITYLSRYYLGSSTSTLPAPPAPPAPSAPSSFLNMAQWKSAGDRKTQP